MKKSLGMVFIIILITGCIFQSENGGEGGSNQQDVESIRAITLDIFYDFNYDDIFGIMDYFSSDFFHNDVDYSAEQQIWYNRFDQWNSANVYNISVIIQGEDFAKVGFTLDLDDEIFNVNSLSENFSDVTILKKIDGIWKIYGNQNSGEDYYSLDVNSQPAAARIYIDGEYTGQVTPHTLTDIPEGQYDVGVYLRDYNEIGETMYVDENEYINFVLSPPSYPTPEFYISSPENGEIINDDYFTLDGYILLFEGNTAILTYNGEEFDLDVDSFGDFNVDIPISSYENTFFVRATNLQGNTGSTDDYMIYQGEDQPPEELTINLTWNTDSTDVDLHIWDPEGNYCSWQSPEGIPNGFLEDDTSGYGPEIFYQSPVTEGEWIVRAHFYDGYDASNPTTAEVEIIIDDETDNFGPYEFTASGDEPGAWWEIGFTTD